MDGTNYDEDRALEKQWLRRRRTEPGAWRIEASAANDTTDALFLTVMLPSSLTSSPAHQIRLLEEADRYGCEIVGPKRTTRWWFHQGHNGLDIEIINTGGEITRYPLWIE